MACASRCKWLRMNSIRSCSTRSAPTALALASPTASAVAPAAATAQAKADAEQLAPYLAAHRQATMNGLFPMPGADLRNASLVQTAP